ncbi:hypothetical protein [Kitasatospora azatica]|uniref:hypothetical protein n=1 Tax=Kitasatospora azatica TaxID=58347 RepID=UPI000564E7AA|nr:hypothetical protein [Kitasatospora azatica]
MSARHFLATGLLALALGLAGAGPAAANPVIIEPDPVSPGSQFAVFDGGNCDSAGGQAIFRSREHSGSGSSGSSAVEDIPAVKLGSLRGLVGAIATVPEHARPGVYDVTVQCTTVTRSQVTTTFTVHGNPAKSSQPAHEESGRPGGSGPGGPGGGGPAGPVEPKGPTHAGLGGSTGPNIPETLAGVLLLGTATAAVVHHHRRRRSS